ncbi:MAG: M23 family metallopeptidase [Solirubrobacteraceae bacterium]|nr:M23 family metallopeptidase [Solirubrobacteraceae bacterium]
MGALTPLVLLSTAVSAHAATGGATASAEPALTGLRCAANSGVAVAAAAAECPRGAVLRLNGENLRSAKTVIFLGGSGTRDDRRATATEASPHRVLVTVPSGAKTGRIKVISTEGGASAPGPKIRITASRRTTTPVAVNGGVFPVDGKYDFGTETNTFGGGRGHEGQDILAKCGLPVVAALAGEVTRVAFQSAAGNYVVVQAADGTSQVYMHLREASALKRGDTIAAGGPVGVVGQTGRASACHLHFELWTAPGWYEGGKPIDPLPSLKAWAGTTGA